MDSAEFRSGNIADADAVLARFDSIFDVLKPSVSEGGLSDTEVESLIAERQNARKQRNFPKYFLISGEGGIRTLGTSLSSYNGLANRPFRPLRHLSVSGGTAKLRGNSHIKIN